MRILTFALLAPLALSTGCTGSQASRPASASPAPDGSDGRSSDERPEVIRRHSARAENEVDIPDLRLPDHAVPTRYIAELTIDPDANYFEGIMEIEVQVRAKTRTLWLNATDLTISQVSLQRGADETPLVQVSEKNDDLIGLQLLAPPATASEEDGLEALRPVPQEFPLGPARIRIQYLGKLGKPDEGGIFRVQADGQWYVYSHFEPLDARQAFPSFDEPNYKVPWQLTMNVKKDHLAFTNTPVASTEPSQREGYTRVRFAESKPLPSYLIAVAVGPFDVVDIGRIGRDKTPARVIVPRGRAADARHATRTIPRVLDWLENYFDMAYPFAKLDSVAIPEQSGAMEHPGLITYGESILLTGEGRDNSRFESFHLMVVAHELAHQWFGNLVTLAWWNDLWLNESFATWMAHKVRRDLHPEWQSELEELTQLEWTKTVDARASARRLRRRIRNNHDIEGTFDAISYGKGGAVLTMFEQWIGEQTFRAGVRGYIREHAWGTTTAEDFLAALGRSSDRDIVEAFQTFLDQPGLPNLSVQLTCEDSGLATVVLRQSRFALDLESDTGARARAEAGAHRGRETVQARPWAIPVCVRYGRRAFEHQQCLLMKGAFATMVLDKVRSCPKRLVANAHAAGYYRVAYDKPLRDSLLGQNFDKLSPLEQLSTLNDVHAQVDDGALGLDEVLPTVPRLARHKAPYVAAKAAALTSAIRLDWVPPSLRDEYARFVNQVFGTRARKLGWTGRRGESPAVIELRSQIVGLVANIGGDAKLRAAASEMADAWLDEGAHIHGDILSAVLTAGLHDADDARYARFENALDKEMSRNRLFPLLTALARTSSEERLRRHWQMMLDNKRDWRFAWFLVGFAMTRPDVQDAAYEFLTANFDELASNLPKGRRGAFFSLFNGICDDRRLRETQAFMAARVAAREAKAEDMEGTLDTIERCVRSRAAQQPEIERFLRAWQPGRRR